jgi:dihydroorotase-like cyclic amidohydrolase
MEGNDADFVLFNPAMLSSISAQTHTQNCDINIYEGITLAGGVEKTVKGGVIVFES